MAKARHPKKKTTKKSPGKNAKASKPRSTARSATPPHPSPRAIVGVVAPSSPAPLVELEIGANRLIDAGFEVFFHPQVKCVEGLFAGSDTERALAFLDYAFDPDLGVIWAARGGYGAIRIRPILDEVFEKAGRPEKKTLVGFSDATVLLEYVRKKWGWRAIHGPMPATFHIERVKGKDWDAFARLVAGEANTFDHRLRPVYQPKGFLHVEGEVVGGNLAMIHSALGTPYAFDLKGKILFLEEVAEAPYRIDRMLYQLLLAGALSGVRAIVLGTFSGCEDFSPQVYAEAPRGKKPRMKALRKTLSEREFYASVFGEIGETLDIPVFRGLPIGHGHGAGSIELGIMAELTADGIFQSLGVELGA